MTILNRRSFLQKSLAGASSAFIAVPPLSSIGVQLEKVTTPKGKIIKRTLGKTSLELPVVSMGVMRADNPGLVRAALEAGITLLDTAHGYQKGKNEQMLGEVLKDYPRHSFVIATKIPSDDRESFLEKLDISLQRLMMSYVDILYLHGATSRDAVLAPGVVEALKIAKQSGKANHVGVSTHRNEPEVIQAAIEGGIYDVVLTALNFKQDHYAELKDAIAKAADAGMGVVAMKTMAGAFHDKERTKPINCRAALKWVLQDRNVGTTIPGITTFDQLADNATVNQDITLTEQERADLAAGKSEGGLYCQGCEQCAHDCRKGLPIPEIMRAYMYTYGYGDTTMAHSLLANLHLRKNPCGECMNCPVTCAKGFRVAERISDITRLSEVPAEFLC